MVLMMMEGIVDDGIDVCSCVLMCENNEEVWYVTDKYI